MVGEGRVKWVPWPKWAPSVTAFLVCNVVKATVVVSTDTPGDIAQRRICFFEANENGEEHICVLGTFLKIIDVPYKHHRFINCQGT